MSYKHICDRCNQEIKDNFVRIEYAEGSNRVMKDFLLTVLIMNFRATLEK